MHKAIRQYMHMVGVMCCILELYGLLIEHCISLCLGGICQNFFAVDKLNYARMIPIYLAEMSQLEGTYSKIWSEFSNGNWVVNKNTIPF